MSNEMETVTNLIDLSFDEDVSTPITPSQPSNNNIPPPVPQTIPLRPVAYFPNESLENNPFDCIQNQADRPDDPFELLSREASFQPEIVNGSVKAEVCTGNLLWISDENIKADEVEPVPVANPLPEFSKLQVPSSRFREPICSVSSIESAPFSPCEDSAFTSGNDSSKTVNKAFITDNTISSASETSRTQSIMNKGFVASCSSLDVSRSSGNSTPECAASGENSDSSGKVRSQKISDARKRLLKLSLTKSTQNSPLTRRPLDEDNSSPLSSVFSEAENLADRFTQFAFDSLKSFDDSCDDLMSIKPNWVDSETDIDSDLEMMKIPILEEIPSPVVSNNLGVWDCEGTEETSKKSVICKNSPDLEALKEKVQQHKAERNNNNQEIDVLIANLKQVIKESVNDAKKAEANVLLESLSNLVNDKKVHEETEKNDSLTPPQPITRQGTFDIDLKDKEDEEEGEKDRPHTESPSVEEPSHQSDEEPSNCSGPNISSGTHSVPSPEPSQPGVSEIVEQIGRLLGNQNVNVVQANLGTSTNGNTNPTYIVVMNTPIQAKQRPSIIVSEYENDGSPELNSSQFRRRSQSLSIHDKNKRLTVPAVSQSPQRNQCSTPIRGAMTRRNSFSNATPTTPNLPSHRRSVYANSGASETITKPSHMPRRSAILETHHEAQHIPQPHATMPMSGLTFNAKKLKFKQSTESIVKASGPMKATVPIKKVAPMIVTTNADSPAEIGNSNFKSVTSTPNVHLTAMKGFPNACSTPMVEASPIKRSAAAKSRYSFVPAAPTPKSSNLGPNTSQTRRRTISELRSPKKISDKPGVSGILKHAVKAVKLPHEFTKSLNKIAPTNSKSVLRLTKTSPTCAAKKNKENKLPKPGQ